MGKYLVFWEVDKTKVPATAKERGQGWQNLMAMVRQDIEKGIVKDWGAFTGEINGYFVAEASEVELGLLTQQYIPFVFFKTLPASSVDQVDEILKNLAAQ